MGVRKHHWDGYVNFVGECSNPLCEAYEPLESHHIIPINHGGMDEIDNIIVLCHKCHHIKDIHIDWVLHYDKLHKWKDIVDSHITIHKTLSHYHLCIILYGRYHHSKFQ